MANADRDARENPVSDGRAPQAHGIVRRAGNYAWIIATEPWRAGRELFAASGVVGNAQGSAPKKGVAGLFAVYGAFGTVEGAHDEIREYRRQHHPDLLERQARGEEVDGNSGVLEHMGAHKGVGYGSATAASAGKTLLTMASKGVFNRASLISGVVTYGWYLFYASDRKAASDPQTPLSERLDTAEKGAGFFGKIRDGAKYAIGVGRVILDDPLAQGYAV